MFYKLYLILIIFLCVFCLSCSSSTPVVKPDTLPNDEFDTDYDKHAFQDQFRFPLESIIMRNMLDTSIEKCYTSSSYGKVPADFEALKQSGYLMGIPKSPFTGEHYNPVSEVTSKTLSGFVYRSDSDASYSYSFVAFRDGNYKVVNVDHPEDVWNQKLIYKPGNKHPADAKIEAMMFFFAFAFQMFYEEHKRLPENPAELLADIQLIEEAWKKPEGADDVYFEFGVDHTNGKIYSKYKYSFGFGKIFAQKVEPLRIIPEHEWDEFNANPPFNILSFNKTPDPAVLILNPWFTLDNLESIYDEVNDR